jgi:hypothetical protein
MTKEEMLAEIEKRWGYTIRDGEVCWKTAPRHWCGTLAIDRMRTLRAELSDLMKSSPGMPVEEALMSLLEKTEIDPDTYRDSPTFKG